MQLLRSNSELLSRLTVLEEKDASEPAEYFQLISSTTGTLTVPAGYSVLLDQFANGVDGVVCKTSGGVPDGSLPVFTAGNALVTTTLDAAGNWVLSGTPASWTDVCIVAAIRATGFALVNSRDDHGTISTGTEDFSAAYSQHTITVTGNIAFTLSGFSASKQSITVSINASEGVVITPPVAAVVDLDSPRDLNGMQAGWHRVIIDSKDSGTSYGIKVESMTAGPLAASPISASIFPSGNIPLLFSEEIEPTTVCSGSGGLGSLKLWDETANAWLEFAYSTTDDLTYTLNPTSSMTSGSNYLVLPTKDIRAKSGRFYSGRPRSFTVGAAFLRSNADLYNDACSSLTGWSLTNGKAGPDTTVVTFDGRTCFRQLTSATPDANNHTRIYRDLGSFGSSLAISVGMYISLNGPGTTGTDCLDIFWFGSDTTKQGSMFLTAPDIKIYVADWVSIGTATPSGAWYDFTSVWNRSTNKVDMYLTLLGSDMVPLSAQVKIANQVTYGENNPARADGFIDFMMRGQITASTCAYLAYIKAGSAVESL
jgi:hypothetical protein